MDDIQKIETLQRRVTEHLADMKRLERENLKIKKRGDLLQKEKDHNRTELSKSTSLRDKLEKLCRELQRENNRLKVGPASRCWELTHGAVTRPPGNYRDDRSRARPELGLSSADGASSARVS